MNNVASITNNLWTMDGWKKCHYLCLPKEIEQMKHKILRNLLKVIPSLLKLVRTKLTKHQRNIAELETSHDPSSSLMRCSIK